MKTTRLTFLCAAALAAGWLAARAWPGAEPARAVRMALSRPASSPVGGSPIAEVRRLVFDARPEAAASLAEKIAALSAADAAALIESLERRYYKEDDPIGRTLAVLCEHLVSLDPALALQTALRLARPRPIMLTPALGKAAAFRSPDVAMRWGRTLKKLDWDASARFWKAFGANASAQAFAALTEGSQEHSMAKSAYMEKLAVADPAAAKAWAARDPELRAAAAEAMAASSPQDALAWLSGLPNDRHTTEARGRVMGRWAATDLTAALGALDADGSPRTLAAASPALRNALASLPPEQVLAALAQFPSLAMTRTGGNTGGSPAGVFVRDFAERDPLGSARTLLGMEPSVLKDEMLAKWAVHWPATQNAQTNGASVRDEIARLLTAEPASAGRDAGVHALITASSLAGDADMAFQWLARQSATMRATSLDRMIRTLAEHDPAALAARWDELPVAEQASQRENFLNAWREQNPGDANAWAVQHGI